MQHDDKSALRSSCRSLEGKSLREYTTDFLTARFGMIAEDFRRPIITGWATGDSAAEYFSWRDTTEAGGYAPLPDCLLMLKPEQPGSLDIGYCTLSWIFPTDKDLFGSIVNIVRDMETIEDDRNGTIESAREDIRSLFIRYNHDIEAGEDDTDDTAESAPEEIISFIIRYNHEAEEGRREGTKAQTYLDKVHDCMLQASDKQFTDLLTACGVKGIPRLTQEQRAFYINHEAGTDALNSTILSGLCTHWE